MTQRERHVVSDTVGLVCWVAVNISPRCLLILGAMFEVLRSCLQRQSNARCN